MLDLVFQGIQYELRVAGAPPEQRGREMVEDLFAPLLAASGKQRWCDKSLSNVTAMERLAAAWPDARPRNVSSTW